MSALSREAPLQSTAAEGLESLAALVLTRIACAGGATRAQISRDLGPMVLNRLSPAEWRSKAAEILATLIAKGFAEQNRSRYRTTDKGNAAVAKFLGEKDSHARAWSEQRDIWLLAKALGVDATKPAIRKALARPEGLSALIVQSAFGLSLRQALSPLKLRAALALVALERAFGNNVKNSGLKKGSAISAQAGRALAGQLLKPPRELNTDARLIAALAAEQVGASRAEIEVMRNSLLRRLNEPAKAAPATASAPKPRPAPPPAAKDVVRTPVHQTVQRPGLAQFSAGVLGAARDHAEGWPGARKAFISQVWNAIRTSHPEWGLSEIEFKDMLAGAHRAGQLVLASADLKNKDKIKDFEDSAILYKNTVWHFVRVED